MKPLITKGILLFLPLFLISCGSFQKIYIEIQEPALITFPAPVRNVLLLDNSVPSESRIIAPLNNENFKGSTNLTIVADSAVEHTASAFSGILYQSNFFNRISYYNKALRTDKEWLTAHRISKETQADLYSLTDCDALISIDRLLFSGEENVKRNSYDKQMCLVDMKFEAKLTCSVYLYGREKPYVTFEVPDSLCFKHAFIADSVLLFKELPETVIHELATRIGEKLADYFIPVWKSAERLIYTSLNSRMREAESYAKANKWDKAEMLWINELEKKSKTSDQVWISLNIAVANEMQDKFDSALFWAEKVKSYLERENTGQFSDEIDLANQYISELQERIQNNRLLDKQFGIE